MSESHSEPEQPGAVQVAVEQPAAPPTTTPDTAEAAPEHPAASPARAPGPFARMGLLGKPVFCPPPPRPAANIAQAPQPELSQQHRGQRTRRTESGAIKCKTKKQLKEFLGRTKGYVDTTPALHTRIDSLQSLGTAVDAKVERLFDPEEGNIITIQRMRMASEDYVASWKGNKFLWDGSKGRLDDTSEGYLDAGRTGGSGYPAKKEDEDGQEAEEHEDEAEEEEQGEEEFEEGADGQEQQWEEEQYA